MKRILRFAWIAPVLAVVAYIAWVAFQIQRQSTRDETRAADVIVVLGAAEYRGKPSPVLKARLGFPQQPLGVLALGQLPLQGFHSARPLLLGVPAFHQLALQGFRFARRFRFCHPPWPPQVAPPKADADGGGEQYRDAARSSDQKRAQVQVVPFRLLR